ncbi:endonuclease/exonuclease/phosphatase family protein [Photobacterium sp. OFAV2-7]|uniref:endonuclease/exonuclease/phosphatase family protein n=1 Tax=Photobacterium sp. OFAV2-7 TaxID=2917748 RepID=UPI001EF4F7BA|nr:endonuclease/exonuclease/phosphatase family protein [Photobacterium sp. OFAV2-7]MCG7585172.1 endonuclease/exonuclease/phosphatase family protein [Photobacterium sp. OFAV2-7]
MKVATFNIENLDYAQEPGNTSFQERLVPLRQMLKRINADILCLQEVHSQKNTENKKTLEALTELVEGTQYQDYHVQYTTTQDGQPRAERNLVVLSKFTFSDPEPAQYNADLITDLMYRSVTSNPVEPNASKLKWERPILHCQIAHPELGNIHIINLHLKSRLASVIKGKKVDRYTWASPAAWGEGYFLSSIKRVGQALETRILLDTIFDGTDENEADPQAKIIVCGDLNAEPGEVPVETICGSVDNTNNAELRYKSLVPCSAGLAESVRYSHFHHGKGNLLDHMLISQSLLPYFDGAKILNETLHDESLPYRKDEKYPASDHAPFIALFRD